MKYIILVMLICICYSANAEEICGGLTEQGKNNEEYLRNRWSELLGWDLFWGYFWVKETRNNIAKDTVKYFGITKWEWDISGKITKDEIRLEI